MQSLKINEQIAFLRRQKGITQEELAHAMGVTNQAVSKWESAVCSPDIQLLPGLAAFFGVSVDELLGYQTPDTMEDLVLKIKSLFSAMPKGEAFNGAFRLCALLHEAIMTAGFTEPVPWNTEINRGTETENRKWGFSACSVPAGSTARSGGQMFIADGKAYHSPKEAQLWILRTLLERLAAPNALDVFYALYELTKADEAAYATAGDIAERCRLPQNAVEAVLPNIPAELRRADGGRDAFRIEGRFMHLPPLLLLIRM